MAAPGCRQQANSQRKSARKLLKGARPNGLQTETLRQRIQAAHDLVNGEGLQDRHT